MFTIDRLKLTMMRSEYGDDPSTGRWIDDPVNHYPHTAANGYDDDLHVPCPLHTTERRLVHRIDMRVIPFLCVLYLLAFLDR